MGTEENVTVDATVTHNGGSLTSGTQWVLKPEDILLLDNLDDQSALIDLLGKIEDARKAAEVPPEPVHPYGLLTIQPGPTAGPVATYNAAARVTAGQTDTPPQLEPPVDQH